MRSMTQVPYIDSRVSYRKRKQGGFHTWTGESVPFRIGEPMYPIAEDNDQGDVDCKGDKGEKSREEREDSCKHGWHAM